MAMLITTLIDWETSYLTYLCSERCCSAATDMTSAIVFILYVCDEGVFMRMFVLAHPKDARAICLASLFMSRAFPALRCVCVCVCAPAMNRALCSEHTAEPSSWFQGRVQTIKKKKNAEKKLIRWCRLLEHWHNCGKGGRFHSHNHWFYGELQIDAGQYVTGGKQFKQVQHLSLYWFRWQ